MLSKRVNERLALVHDVAFLKKEEQNAQNVLIHVPKHPQAFPEVFLRSGPTLRSVFIALMNQVMS